MQAMMRGRKSEAEKIEVQGITEAKLEEAARVMDGFSGVRLMLAKIQFVRFFFFVIWKTSWRRLRVR